MKLGKIMGAFAVTLTLSLGLCISASAAEIYLGAAKPVNASSTYGTITESEDCEVLTSSEVFAVPICVGLTDGETSFSMYDLGVDIKYDSDKISAGFTNSSGTTSYSKMNTSNTDWGFSMYSNDTTNTNSEPVVKVTLVNTNKATFEANSEVCYVYFTVNDQNKNLNLNEETAFALTVTSFTDGDMKKAEIDAGSNAIKAISNKNTEVSFTIPAATAIDEEYPYVAAVYAEFSDGTLLRGTQGSDLSEDDKTADRGRSSVQLTQYTVAENGDITFTFNVENLALDHKLSPSTTITLKADLQKAEDSTSESDKKTVELTSSNYTNFKAASVGTVESAAGIIF